jgi:hypothetical protein
VRANGLRAWNQGVLWVADLDTGRHQRLFSGGQLLYYSLSADGQRIVFVTIDDRARSPVWVAPLKNPNAARQITTANASFAYLGAPGEVMFGGAEDFAIVRITEGGGEPQKVIPTPLMPLSVSSDGEWIAVQDARACGALIVYPMRGGSPLRLCDRCAPPWAPRRCLSLWDGRLTASSCSGTSAFAVLHPIGARRHASTDSSRGTAVQGGGRCSARRPAGHERTSRVSRPHPSMYVVMKVTKYLPRPRSTTDLTRGTLSSKKRATAGKTAVPFVRSHPPGFSTGGGPRSS